MNEKLKDIKKNHIKELENHLFIDDEPAYVSLIKNSFVPQDAKDKEKNKAGKAPNAKLAHANAKYR